MTTTPEGTTVLHRTPALIEQVWNSSAEVNAAGSSRARKGFRRTSWVSAEPSRRYSILEQVWNPCGEVNAADTSRVVCALYFPKANGQERVGSENMRPAGQLTL